MSNKRFFPTTVDFALTGKCNLRCKHCNTADTWDVEGELSFDEVVGVLDSLKEEKVFNLNLFGGEPFCFPRIFDFLEVLNNYPMRVSILTNGTLIDSVAVKYIKKLKFLSNVQVSIDGSNSEIHDWQRGAGAFDKSMKAVDLLLKNKIPMSIKAVINAHNYKDIESMVKMAIRLGFGGMDFGDAIECGRAAVYSQEMHFKGEVYRDIMKTIFELNSKYPNFTIGGTLGQKIEMLSDFYENGPGAGSRGEFSTCPAGQDTIAIRSDGKVVPCSAFWTLICGDLRKSSLRDIWDNSQVLNEIRDLARKPLVKCNEECTSCDYLSYCNGGCRAAAYYSTGKDLEGIEKATCLVFSNIYGYRVPEETVLTKRSCG